MGHIPAGCGVMPPRFFRDKLKFINPVWCRYSRRQPIKTKIMETIKVTSTARKDDRAAAE